MTYLRGLGGTSHLAARPKLLAMEGIYDGVSAKPCFPAGVNRRVRHGDHIYPRNFEDILPRYIKVDKADPT